MNVLLIWGVGYSASVIARRLCARGWRVFGTSRGAARPAHSFGRAWEPLEFDGAAWSAGLGEAVGQATHMLASIPPDEAGDSVIRCFATELKQAPRLRWLGYLSTVGVYGDHGGGWVDESTPPAPVSDRSRQRLLAEQQWARLSLVSAKRLDVFRLAGIYGPGRSAIDKLSAGMKLQAYKPGQVFNRIHVEDVANVVEAAIMSAGDGGPAAGAASIYNVADDEPASPEAVTAYAASLLGVPPPPLVPLERAGLSGMARSFYAENKRVRNVHMKGRLGVRLSYPTFREGLAAILHAIGR